MPDSTGAKLPTLDRFLPLWIGLAMAAGLLLGRLVPGLGSALSAVEIAGISLPIAIGLLDKLGSDDDFRAVFSADPRQALVQLGFAPAADASIREGLWKCFQVNELASKEILQCSHGILLRQLYAEIGAPLPIYL